MRTALILLFTTASCLIPVRLQAAEHEGASASNGWADLVSNRILGEWSLAADLSASLGGDGAPPEIGFRLGTTMPPATGLVWPEEVQTKGVMEFGSQQFLFGVTTRPGQPRLLCFPVGATPPSGTQLYFVLVPARQQRYDLLFLGGTSPRDPFFAYRRSPGAGEAALTLETRSLLQELRLSTSGVDGDLVSRLAIRPDWLPLATSLLEQMDSDPEESHSQEALLLTELLSRHANELTALNLRPLIGLLAIGMVPQQQRVAEALAAASRNRALFNGYEKEAIGALIPLTTSQRGGVVAAALTTLHVLTQESWQRDPLAWAGWFEKNFGAKLGLNSAVFEWVAVVRWTPGAGFKLDGKTIGSESQLNGQLARFVQEAREQSLRPAVVFSLPELHPLPEIPGPLRESVKLLESLGVEITLAPANEPFYPRFPLRPSEAS